jgi:hypothetical protein
MAQPWAQRRGETGHLYPLNFLGRVIKIEERKCTYQILIAMITESMVKCKVVPELN